MLDETFLTILVSATKFAIILGLITKRRALEKEANDILHGHFVLQSRYLLEATHQQLEKFCPISSSNTLNMYQSLTYIYHMC